MSEHDPTPQPTTASPPAAHRFAAQLRSDEGATTAEYAITTLAACGLAGLLVVLLKGDIINDLLASIITGALGIGS